MTFDIDSAISSNQPTGRQAPEPVRQRTEPVKRAGGAAFVPDKDSYGYWDDTMSPGYINPDDPNEKLSQMGLLDYEMDETFGVPKEKRSEKMIWEAPIIDAVTTAEAAKPEEERMMDDIDTGVKADRVIRKKLGANRMNLKDVMRQPLVHEMVEGMDHHGADINQVLDLYAKAIMERLGRGMKFQDAFEDAVGKAYPYDAPALAGRLDEDLFYYNGGPPDVEPGPAYAYYDPY